MIKCRYCGKELDCIMPCTCKKSEQALKCWDRQGEKKRKEKKK